MLDSGFFCSSSGFFTGWSMYLLTPILRPLFGSGVKSAQPSGIRLARLTLGELSDTATAAYYNADYALDTEKPTSAFCKSLIAVTKLQAELWDYSVKWAEITKDELKAAGF